MQQLAFSSLGLRWSTTSAKSTGGPLHGGHFTSIGGLPLGRLGTNNKMAKSEQELSSLLDAIIEKKTQSSESKVWTNYLNYLHATVLILFPTWSSTQQIIYTLVYASRLAGTDKADKRELGGRARRSSPHRPERLLQHALTFPRLTVMFSRFVYVSRSFCSPLRAARHHLSEPVPSGRSHRFAPGLPTALHSHHRGQCCSL